MVIMTQNLNSIPPFDGTNYGYWKARIGFFFSNQLTSGKLFKSSAQLSNDKAIHALCQALSPSEFARITNCEIAKDA
jgi:hypothetical protein